MLPADNPLRQYKDWLEKQNEILGSYENVSLDEIIDRLHFKDASIK